MCIFFFLCWDQLSEGFFFQDTASICSLGSLPIGQWKEEFCQHRNKVRFGPSFHKVRVRARFRGSMMVRVRVRTRVGARCGV